MRRFVGVVVVSGLLSVASAFAADLAGLSWGEFVFDETGGAKPPVVSVASHKGTLSADMKLDGVVANADVEKTEASAVFTGQFLATQPKRVELGSFKATVSGLIVKTAGTTARIDFSFGDIKKTVEWQDADVKSERYTTEIVAAVPGSRIPVPFPVTALLLAKKADSTGTVLITVDSIKIDVGPALVGETSPELNKQNPTPPQAVPDEFASRSVYFRL